MIEIVKLNFLDSGYINNQKEIPTSPNSGPLIHGLGGAIANNIETHDSNDAMDIANNIVTDNSQDVTDPLLTRFTGHSN